MQPTTHINDCPFCGDDATLQGIKPTNSYQDEPYFVACTSCGATGPIDDDKDRAIEKWNDGLPTREVANAVLREMGRNPDDVGKIGALTAKVAMMRLVLAEARRYIKAHWHEQHPGVLLADITRLIGEDE